MYIIYIMTVFLLRQLVIININIYKNCIELVKNDW